MHRCLAGVALCLLGGAPAVTTTPLASQDVVIEGAPHHDHDARRWIVRRQPEETGSGMFAKTTLHVVRVDHDGHEHEVATFADSEFIQTNPTMHGSTTWRFFYDGSVFCAEQTTRQSRPKPGADDDDDSEEEPPRVTVLRWNGSAFAPPPAPPARAK